MPIKESIYLSQTYIEGTDCCGKDELANRLAAVTGENPTRHLVIDRDNPHEKILNELETSEEKLFAGIIIARTIMHDIGFAANGRLPTDSNIQVSLHALRAVAFETARGGDLTGIFQELLKYCPLFDLTILLTASLECKRRRLANREETTGQSSEFDNLMFTKPDFVMAMDEVIFNQATDKFGAVVIDTDNMSLDEVFEKGKLLLENGYVEEPGVKRPIKGRLIQEPFHQGEKNYFNKELERYSNFLKKKFIEE